MSNFLAGKIKKSSGFRLILAYSSRIRIKLSTNRRSERIETTSPATYVCAAAESTCFAPFTSVVSSVQDAVRFASARFDASNSTGSVTNENKTEIPKNTQPPITKYEPMLVYDSAERITPMMISGNSMPDIKFETCARALRTFKNLYPCACWIAWPASCAATPSAAIDVESYTLSESASVLSVGL